MSLTLRPAQADILTYTGGKMAVSAVPGSGKTFTLSLLAAQIIAGGQIDVAHGQQILIVTYMNSGVDNFKRRIRQRLDEMGVQPAGFDVRTLHSLGLEIVRFANGGGDRMSIGVSNDLLVLDDTQRSLYLNRAIDNWREANDKLWREFEPEGDLQQRNRWRSIVERTAHAVIRTAKNERLQPDAIMDSLRPLLDEAVTEDAIVQNPYFLWMFAGIYHNYQHILRRQGALDFDDLIGDAADLIEQRPDLAQALSRRWPFVLEDEAQDSVPLQERLLGALTADSGNLVRVGDPNQAITSTFTAAHPRYFIDFIHQPDVVLHPLPNSGRSAPLIIGAANSIVHWVLDQHPVSEVAENTFLRQEILPTPAGDAQPNPPDGEAGIRIKVYRNREEEELPDVARLAMRYAEKYPERTLAILVPTNDLGHKLSDHLDHFGLTYDNLLRGGNRERRIATAIHALLAVLANPLSARLLADAFQALYDMRHPAAFDPSDEDAVADEAGAPVFDYDRFEAILRSVQQPERILFPQQDGDVATALPAGVATDADLLRLDRYAGFVQRIFDLRPLPIDDLALALGDELFATGGGDELDLALAYQLASIMRRWRDAQPEWRLPDIVAQLADVAAGRRQLPLTDPDALGFEPEPGRITLMTQHKSKGLEWDAVFLVGIDARWLPGSLEAYFQGNYSFLGGNPEAQAIAELRQLMNQQDLTYPGRTPTESANIEIISERLRLLYVAITRTRRYLHMSRSRATRSYRREFPSEPASVMGVLYQYLQSTT